MINGEGPEAKNDVRPFAHRRERAQTGGGGRQGGQRTWGTDEEKSMKLSGGSVLVTLVQLGAAFRPLPARCVAR